MNAEQPKKKDLSLQTLGAVFVGATLLRVGYEIYQIQNRVHKLENYMEQNEIPIIRQKPIISTPEYFIISDTPKEIAISTQHVVTITLFTRGQYEIVPRSLVIHEIGKPSTSKMAIVDLPRIDISQGNRTIQIPFSIIGIQKGKSHLTVDFSFNIQKKGSSTKQEIRRKVVLPLNVT